MLNAGHNYLFSLLHHNHQLDASITWRISSQISIEILDELPHRWSGFGGFEQGDQPRFIDHIDAQFVGLLQFAAGLFSS